LDALVDLLFSGLGDGDGLLLVDGETVREALGDRVNVTDELDEAADVPEREADGLVVDERHRLAVLLRVALTDGDCDTLVELE